MTVERTTSQAARKDRLEILEKTVVLRVRPTDVLFHDHIEQVWKRFEAEVRRRSRITEPDKKGVQRPVAVAYASST